MKKDIRSRNNSRLFKKGAILLLNCSLIFIACNNKKEEKKDQATNDSSVNQGGDKVNSTDATVVAPLTGSLYTLKLTKVQYDSLKRYNGSTKMVLQFCFKAEDAKSPTLLAYPSKTQDKFYINTTGSAFNPAELTSGQAFMAVEKRMIFGDQEMTYRSIDDFLRENHINTTQAYTLVFSPDIKPDNHIYYKITVDGVAALAGTLETNPSPPKDAE
jgi:hypothetical protein